MPIVNLKNADSDCLIRVIGSNESFVVASNTVADNTFVTAHDAQHNIAAVAVTLKKAIWSTDNFITITRVVNASSNVVVARFNYSGTADWDALGMCSNAALDFAGANLAVNCSANSYLLLKIGKKCVPAPDYDPSLINA